MRFSILCAAGLSLGACGDDTSTSNDGGGDSSAGGSMINAPANGGAGAQGGATPNGGAPGTGGSPEGGSGTGGDAAGGAQAFFLEDSLKGQTSGLQVGGTLGPDGWTVTGNADRIIWELPRLVSGSVEFTVTNMTMANLPLNDHEIFAMYEAGYDIEEPIPYNPDYRNNHYKTMIRVYGQQEVGREGQQKIMWGMCPDGAPGHGECQCGTSFFEEPFGGDGNWPENAPQRLRVEWGGGFTRYLRNDEVILEIDWSGAGLAFAPQELHMSLGTSRPLEVGDASMPIGAVFSDLVVEGLIGDSVEICP